MNTNLIGYVICAWFHEQAHLMLPGSKSRPCLVVDIDHASNKILLAYGTSQQTERQDRGQITIKYSEMPALAKDTKLSLCTPLWVPMTAELLSRNPSELHVQVVGQVPRSLAARLVHALEKPLDANSGRLTPFINKKIPHLRGFFLTVNLSFLD